MLIVRCAKAFLKAFLSPFTGCRLITLHRHPIYSSQLTRLESCDCLFSVVRHSHSAVASASVSCQKLDHRSLVRVCGTDVLGFLQGLVTNDAKLLETDGSSMYAMMLNVQACITCVLMFMYLVPSCLVRSTDLSLWLRANGLGRRFEKWEFRSRMVIGGLDDKIPRGEAFFASEVCV